MWDAVHPLVGYAIVPATDEGVSSSPPTRDGVLGRSGVGYTLYTSTPTNTETHRDTHTHGHQDT